MRTTNLCDSSQLFGVEDPDEDVSPDTADPEAVGKYRKVYIISVTMSAKVTHPRNRIYIFCCAIH
jgi:hypothetical protein